MGPYDLDWHQSLDDPRWTEADYQPICDEMIAKLWARR